MPVTGLPVVLDASLNGLMQESTLSSFKIFSNENGSSTVLINFVSTPRLPRQFSTNPPRSSPKSQSRLKRDTLRRETFFNDKHTSVRSSGHFLSKPPSSSPTQLYKSTITETPPSSPPRPCNNSVDDDATLVLTPNSPDVPSSTQIGPSNTTVSKNDKPAVSDVHPQSITIVENDHMTPRQAVSPPFITSLLTPPSPSKYDNHEECKQTKNFGVQVQEESEIVSFTSDNDTGLVNLKQNMNDDMKDRIHDIRRNKRILRVAETKSPDREPAFLVLTDGILIAMYAESKILGPIHILENPNYELMLDNDKSQIDLLDEMSSLDFQNHPNEREHCRRYHGFFEPPETMKPVMLKKTLINIFVF